MPDLIFICLDSSLLAGKVSHLKVNTSQWDTVIYFFSLSWRSISLSWICRKLILSNFWDICLGEVSLSSAHTVPLCLELQPALTLAVPKPPHKVWCWNCFYLLGGHVLDRMMLQLSDLPMLTWTKSMKGPPSFDFLHDYSNWGSADTKYIALI